MQAVNDQVIAYCQQQMGLAQVPNVSDSGMEMQLSAANRLQLFLQGDRLWFLLELGPTHPTLEEHFSRQLENLDTRDCFFQAFVTQEGAYCIATFLKADAVNVPNLDSVFERMHQVHAEVSRL